MTEKKASVYAGLSGEKKTAEILSRLPADRYHVFNDLLLKTGYGTSQIDHLVVCAGGVFVIETKNYGGTVQGKDGDRLWTQVHRNPDTGEEEKRSFYNPVRQNFTHIQALRQLLRPVAGEISFISVVVFPENCELAVHTRSRVVRFGELDDLILGREAVVLSPEKQEKIGAFLESANIRDPAMRKKHAASVRKKQNRY